MKIDELLKDLPQEIIKVFNEDFKALEGYQNCLLSHYDQEQLMSETQMTQKLYQEIGQPPKTLTVRVLGHDDKGGDYLRNLFVKLLVSIDPIFARFLFYVNTGPEDIATREKILSTISQEHEAFLSSLFLGPSIPARIINFVMGRYEHYRGADISYYKYLYNPFLIGQDPLSIASLRQRLQIERERKKDGCIIHERIMIRFYPYYNVFTEREILEDSEKRYEREFKVIDNTYDSIDDNFVDLYLCSGANLNVKGFSDKFVCEGKIESCDEKFTLSLKNSAKLIVKCGSERKEFKLSLMAKYEPLLKASAKKYGGIEDADSVACKGFIEGVKNHPEKDITRAPQT